MQFGHLKQKSEKILISSIFLDFGKWECNSSQKLMTTFSKWNDSPFEQVYIALSLQKVPTYIATFLFTSRLWGSANKIILIL
jgi:hypothetical protein